MFYAATCSAKIDQAFVVEGVYFYSVDEHRLGIVLTPTCDFANEKAQFVQICSVVTAKSFVDSIRRADWKNLNESNLRGQIKVLARQKLPRYHWLAPFPGTSEPLVADFQNLATLAFEEASDLRIVACLASPFREQLPARYGAYISRVGTPEFTDDELDQWASTIVS